MNTLIDASLVESGLDGMLSMHNSIAIMARHIIINATDQAAIPTYRVLEPKVKWTSPSQVCNIGACSM